MKRFQFVEDHYERYGVKRLCAVIGVARSSYYCWKATADERLAGQIRAANAASDGSSLAAPLQHRPPPLPARTA